MEYLCGIGGKIKWVIVLQMFLFFFLHEQETSSSLLQKCDKYQPKCDKYQPKDNHDCNKSGTASDLSNRRSVPLQMPLAVLSISLSDNAVGVKLQVITVSLSVKTNSNSIPVNTNTDTALPVSLVSTELQLLLNF